MLKTQCVIEIIGAAIALILARLALPARSVSSATLETLGFSNQKGGEGLITLLCH